MIYLYSCLILIKINATKYSVLQQNLITINTLSLHLQFIFTSKYFYCIETHMFLQKYRVSFQKEQIEPQKEHAKTMKIGDLLKKMRPIEIKKHQRKNIYTNPRESLIQNTQILINSPQKQAKQSKGAQNEKYMQFHLQSSRKKDSFSRTYADLSSREARRLAAKSFRERIWKSSDITPYIKAQQQKNLHKKRGYYQSIHGFGDSQQKIHRYQDSLLMIDQEIDPERKEEFKKQWLQGAIKNNLSHRTSNSQKNQDKLQITNIEFKQQMEESGGSNHSRLLINRERRKELRMRHYSVLGRQQKRPNTTGGYNHRQKIDDNIIQPW